MASSSYSFMQPLLLSIGLMLCGTKMLVEGQFAPTPEPDQRNFQQDMVDAHNEYRSSMGIEPLTWNTTLQAYAEAYAKQRSGDCALIHSHGPYGENIFWARGPGIENARYAVDGWWGEKNDYDYATNTCASGKACAHYTQIVWKNTQQIGCAYVFCTSNNGGYWVVCSYDPPGNYNGEKPY
ncbi:hypothetical protein NE237_017553 [Protea cynaroides]|uniref:SCP domain-containing protein n=1 Tax=Protea cynaroides TaxID=273540 RepID=A0A9Q0K884_9MAGN|nr:hypothetical protein NE237_017553 [Protea cynaroides]